MSEDQLQELLREMRDEAVPPDSLARVRSRVARGTSPRAFNVWRIPAFGLLAAAIALVITVVPRTTAPLPLTPPPVPPAPLLVPQAGAAVAAQHRVTATRRVKRPVQRAAVPVQIRIETDDPEIVILLTGE